MKEKLALSTVEWLWFIYIPRPTDNATLLYGVSKKIQCSEIQQTTRCCRAMGTLLTLPFSRSLPDLIAQRTAEPDILTSLTGVSNDQPQAENCRNFKLFEPITTRRKRALRMWHVKTNTWRCTGCCSSYRSAEKVTAISAQIFTPAYDFLTFDINKAKLPVEKYGIMLESPLGK